MRVIIVDSSFSRSSPSSLALVRLIEKGDLTSGSGDFSFEVWARSVDPTVQSKVVFRPLVCRLPGRIFGLWALFGEIQLRFFREKFFGKNETTVVISNGFLAPFADLVTVHFSGANWLMQTLKVGRSEPQAWRAGIRAAVVAAMDLVFQWSLNRNRLLAVSHSVRDDLQRRSGPWKEFGMIPNLAADDCYCPAFREQNRQSAREEFKISADEVVLGFCAMGHLRRKGFWKAAQAIAKAREEGTALTFLVIGIEAATVCKVLDQWCPEWRSFMKFAGRVDQSGYALSACDGYFFPSYSEAFSLTEIEAAALGLRLYLTPHFGTEMFDDRAFHGRILPWDSTAISKVLIEEYQAGVIQAGAASPNESLSEEEATELWTQEILGVINRYRSKKAS